MLHLTSGVDRPLALSLPSAIKCSKVTVALLSNYIKLGRHGWRLAACVSCRQEACVGSVAQCPVSTVDRREAREVVFCTPTRCLIYGNIRYDSPPDGRAPRCHLHSIQYEAMQYEAIDSVKQYNTINLNTIQYHKQCSTVYCARVLNDIDKHRTRVL